MASNTRETRRINLALQGGGAHGAFTWGVLERLLAEDWLQIAAISGTSAGALNAAAVKAGLAHAPGRAGREAALANLEWVWSQVGRVPDFRANLWAEEMLPYLHPAARRWLEIVSPLSWLDAMTRVFSPYDYGRLWRDPLRPVVEGLPFSEICAPEGPALFVTATNVRSGKIRVFAGRQVTVDAILASACLPTLFRAVEIYDPKSDRIESYWDGGYSGNPALFPLFEHDFPRDILVVGINPLIREAVPQTPAQIEDRINEISFNSSLLREMRAISFVKRLIAEGRLENRDMKDVLMHMITDDGLMTSLSVETKLIPDRRLLARLRASGQDAADRWLSDNADHIGHQETVDLVRLFG